MPIDLTDKIVALFAALSNDDIDALTPVQRRRLAEQCRRVSVFSRLRLGRVAEELRIG